MSIYHNLYNFQVTVVEREYITDISLKKNHKQAIRRTPGEVCLRAAKPVFALLLADLRSFPSPVPRPGVIRGGSYVGPYIHTMEIVFFNLKTLGPGIQWHLRKESLCYVLNSASAPGDRGNVLKLRTRNRASNVSTNACMYLTFVSGLASKTTDSALQDILATTPSLASTV